MDGLVWFSYSTSASASAVRSLHAPIHRLQALVDVALVEEIDECARDGGLVLRAPS